VAGWRGGVQALAAGRPPAQAGQIGFGARLIEEDEPRRVETPLAAPPRPPRFLEVGPVLLTGPERLFLYASPIAWST
jgi:hypothetical protein